LALVIWQPTISHARAAPVPTYEWLDDVVSFFEEANKQGGIAVLLDNARR
jgi:hypothetical protein